MTTNKNKLIGLAEKDDSSLLKEIDKREKKRDLIRESFNIAIKILIRLDELNWSQKDLAVKLGIMPQHVNKIVKGKQNLTLESLIKLQSLLNIPLLASYYEHNQNKKIQIKQYPDSNIQKIKINNTFTEVSSYTEAPIITYGENINKRFQELTNQYSSIAS